MTPLSLPDGPVVVFAPHPDDETLGCGGLISRCIDSGLSVHVVFVTDGGASHPRSATWPRARLAARREAEAGEALERLGAGAAPRTFLRLRDAAMPAPGSDAWRIAVAAVSDVLAAHQPALVVLPWRRDPHGDHRATWSLAQTALAAVPERPAVIEYAIWLDELGAPDDHPRPGEVEPVVLAVAPWRKRHAIEAHRSQLGLVVRDDPGGFALTPATVARLTGPEERYWRPCGGA